MPDLARADWTSLRAAAEPNEARALSIGASAGLGPASRRRSDFNGPGCRGRGQPLTQPLSHVSHVRRPPESRETETVSPSRGTGTVTGSPSHGHGRRSTGCHGRTAARPSSFHHSEVLRRVGTEAMPDVPGPPGRAGHRDGHGRARRRAGPGPFAVRAAGRAREGAPTAPAGERAFAGMSENRADRAARMIT